MPSVASAWRDAEKPNVVDAERRERMARLDLAHISERRRLLRSRFVRTAAPARSENHGDAPVFVERPGEIRRYRGFVVGMRHHHENVRFVALIWLGERPPFLRHGLRRESSKKHGQQSSGKSKHW